MKVKQPGTNIMVITFVLTSLINERKASRNEYNGHNICSGLYINRSNATQKKYYGHNIRSGLYINESKATRIKFYGYNIRSGLFNIK